MLLRFLTPLPQQGQSSSGGAAAFADEAASSAPDGGAASAGGAAASTSSSSDSGFDGATASGFVDAAIRKPGAEADGAGWQQQRRYGLYDSVVLRAVLAGVAPLEVRSGRVVLPRGGG
jgi:hypothetical protein